MYLNAMRHNLTSGAYMESLHKKMLAHDANIVHILDYESYRMLYTRELYIYIFKRAEKLMNCKYVSMQIVVKC